MKLTKVEHEVLEASRPNAPNKVFSSAAQWKAFDTLVKYGLLRKENVKGRFGSVYYYATKAGIALLKRLRGKQ